MNKPEQPSLFIHFRFLLLFVLSIALLAFDMRSKVLKDFRYYLETALYPVLMFADSPNAVSRMVSTQFKGHSELIEENEKLSSEIFLQRADILRLKSLESENEAMRKLLNSPQRSSSKRLFAEVIDVDSNPYLRRVVVNSGAQSGVYEGMPVVTDQGLVGQVISVNFAYSRVLLLTDPSSAIPILDMRNQTRAIASGSGVGDEILVNNVPRSTDIRVGDLLVTSGLGGRFPEGYPVATVTSVGFDESQPFALIKAKPSVDLDRMRYVLMFWYNDIEETEKIAEQHFKKPTDSKIILKQEKIKRLIESLSRQDNSETKIIRSDISDTDEDRAAQGDNQ